MYSIQCAYKVSKKYCHHFISGEIKKDKLACTRSVFSISTYACLRVLILLVAKSQMKKMPGESRFAQSLSPPLISTNPL